MTSPSPSEAAIAAALQGSAGDPQLAVAAVQDGTRIVLRVEGEIDLATSSLLADHLERAESQAPASLVLDVGGVTFMDSTGVSLVLHALDRARAGGWSFALGRPPLQVRRLLELVGVADIVTIEE